MCLHITHCSCPQAKSHGSGCQLWLWAAEHQLGPLRCNEPPEVVETSLPFVLPRAAPVSGGAAVGLYGGEGKGMGWHWEWWGAALGWGQWWSTMLLSACSSAAGRSCPRWLGKCWVPGRAAADCGCPGAPRGTPAPSQLLVVLLSPSLAPDGHSNPESSRRSLCGHSLALLWSTLGRAGASRNFPCPQPRPQPVMPRVGFSPHKIHFIFISAQAAELLLGVHSQNPQVPGGSSTAPDGDSVSLPCTPAPGQAAPGPPAHTAFHHPSHLVTICNKPGEGEDLGDPGERAMWGSRIWPVLKGLKKKNSCL